VQINDEIFAVDCARIDAEEFIKEAERGTAARYLLTHLSAAPAIRIRALRSIQSFIKSRVERYNKLPKPFLFCYSEKAGLFIITATNRTIKIKEAT
jgi:hypothetical protein